MYSRMFAIALAASLAPGCTTPPGPAPSSTEQANGTATLQAVFGPPSQAGFGSAVFAEPAARSSIERLLDGHEKPDAARQALSAVYDDAGMDTVEVYTLGDGAALSGVLIAGRATNGAATLLAFLMD